MKKLLIGLVVLGGSYGGPCVVHYALGPCTVTRRRGNGSASNAGRSDGFGYSNVRKSGFRLHSSIDFMGSKERKARAEIRRQSAVVISTELTDALGEKEDLRGLEAMALAWRLTREAWSLSGKLWPEYDRASIPLRFKPKSD